MSERYVLPSIVPHDDDGGFGSTPAFLRWRKRTSSTPLSSHTGSDSPTASPAMTRSSTRLSHAPPPSSFRPPPQVSGTDGSRLVLQRDYGSSSPLPAAPIPQKRRSSLTLDARLRPSFSAHQLQQKNLPSTPISTTPSLTFSHSRGDSRSDDEAFTSPTISPARADAARHHLRLDPSSPSPYAFEQVHGVYGKGGRNAASVGNLHSGLAWHSRTPSKECSFLPLSHEGHVWSPTEGAGTGRARSTRKTAIEFQQRSPRNPDKVAHLLGEEYQEAQRVAALRGQQQPGAMSSSASLVSSKSGFKGFFSSIRGRKKRDEDEVDENESSWERERRLEEKRSREEKKRQEALARTLDLLSEFSLDRPPPAQKASKAGRASVDGGSDNASLSRPRRTTGDQLRTQVPQRRVEAAIDLPEHMYRSQRHVPMHHRSQRSDDSATLVGSSRYQRMVRRNSTASIADGSFLRMDMGAYNSSSGSHSRTASDISSASSASRRPGEDESFLAMPRKAKPSSSHLASSTQEHQHADQVPLSEQDLLFTATDSQPGQDVPSIKGKEKSGGEHGRPHVRSSSRQSLAEICQRLQDQSEPDCLTPRGAPAKLQTSDSIPTIEEPASEPWPSSTTHPPAVVPLPIPQLAFSPSESAESGTELLQPLTKLLDECMTANRREHVRPWGSERERSKLLSSASSRDAIPKSWAGYVRAYAKGDLDLNNPPAPRSAPLVKKAVPRSSPGIGSSPSTSSLVPQSPSSPMRQGLRGKASCGSLGSHQELAASLSSREYANIPTLPPTPPLHASLRDRLPSPRFGIRRSRSREVVHENMKLPRDDLDDIRLQAEELAAVGGMGDIRGPRPVWEADRNASAKEYIDILHNRPNPKLTSIVEKLAEKLKVSYAGAQILMGDQTILLASSGLDEGARVSLEVFSTPRLDSFGDGADEGKVLPRDRTLDAHTILNRDGVPLVIPDLSQDWRFERREAADIYFYAGASIFAFDSGLPIGTVSVMHDQAKELSKEERDALTAAAREVERELEHSRHRAFEEKLQDMDGGILAWIRSLQAMPTPNPHSPPSTPLSPSSASRLAERRGARKPAPIDTSQTFPPLSADQLMSSRLGSALETIVSTLQVELAYIARVGSDPLQCAIEAQRESGIYPAGKLSLDAGMHLSALTALKRGLQFDKDCDQLHRLLGDKVSDANQSIGLPTFCSAILVGCGLKDGGKAHRGTEGWVLAVASRGGSPLRYESNAYLRKFATLLAPILLQGPRSPQVQTAELPTLSPSTPLASNGLAPMSHSSSPTTPVFVTPRSSPLSSTFTSTKKQPPLPRMSSKKRIPVASPPPSAPLPLPPVSPTYARGQGLGRPRAFSDLRSSLSACTSVSHNEDLEVLDSEDGHFAQEKIGRGESPLGVVRP